MAKQILFVLDWYPTETNNGCIFAKHLICAIADMGYDCAVVAPRPIHRGIFQKANLVSYFREELTAKGSKVRIYMPHFIHLTSRKETMGLSMNNHLRAVMGVIRREKLEPDLVYGHFLYQCGLTAARIGEKLGIPSYCACGENSLRLEKGSKPYATGLAYHGWQEIIRKLSGIVCVSGNNEVLLRENGFIDDAMKTGVFPNGVDENKFHILDKARCRRELGLPENAFIVAYTGTFSANKGVDRLSQALKDCPDVWSVFMGQGALEPDCDRILHKGRVPNDQVAKYLNAADVFVLPTRGEGCCNAIVEALSCGLPVISSDLPFNDDILNEENSLRIDVEDVEAIRRSILRLYEDPQLRKALAEGAKNSAKNLKIQARAKRILEFMELSL
jgi:glycosyltransferase involved in cell wall biosynthesis